MMMRINHSKLPDTPHSNAETLTSSCTPPLAAATSVLTKSDNRKADQNRFAAVAAEVFASSLYPFHLAGAILGIKPRHFEKWIETGKIRRHHIPRANGTAKTPYVDIVEIYRFLAGGAANKVGNKPKPVALSAILRKPECQSRIATSADHVADYREHFEEGEHGMDPVLIIKVGDEMWLVDGFTRVAAAEAEKRETIMAYVLPGTVETATETARRINTYHGHRFTNQDMNVILRKMIAQHPELLTALVDQTVPVRQLQKLTGFSKSALSLLAIQLRDEQANTANAQPKSSQGNSTVSGSTGTNIATKMAAGAMPPASQVADDPEVASLLNLLRSKLSELPANGHSILTSHATDLAIIAGAALRLLAIHFCRAGLATLHDVRAVLKKHPLPTPTKA
jgi:hypothetical protein